MNNFSVCRAVEHIRKARLTELKARETSCPNGKKVWMRKCRTIRICGGKPDERKDLSNSLRNDSLLDKLVDELANGKAMEKIKRTNK